MVCFGIFHGTFSSHKADRKIGITYRYGHYLLHFDKKYFRMFLLEKKFSRYCILGEEDLIIDFSLEKAHEMALF